MGVSRDQVAPGLSEQQERVIAHDAGALLVLGAAGTGRTEALARRLGRLVAEGERALVLSSSAAAANRIRERAEETIDAAFEELVVHTHPAAAARLLHEHATEARIDPFFESLNPDERLAMLLERVDEAEDACSAERSLIEALARGAQTAVISCDDEQARARCDAASSWARRALSPEEISLEPAWRYGGDLLDAAHAVVAPAERGAEVPRRAAGPSTRVTFWVGTNERAEAQAVARDIETALADGEVKLEEICVAVPRGGGRARAVAAALEERRVPYLLPGPGAFFQR